MEKRQIKDTEALHRLFELPDSIIKVAWKELPSPIEIDFEEDAAMRRFIRAVVREALNQSV